MFRDFGQLDHEPANPVPLPRSQRSRALLRAALLQEQPREADDPEAERRQARNRAAALQLNRALELFKRIKSEKTVDSQKVIRTTQWLPVPDTPDDRTHAEARLHQIEKVTDRGILGIPRKRRVSEIRVETRYVDDDSQQTTEPICAYFMKPCSDKTGPVIDHADDSFEANESRNHTMPGTDQWQGLDNVLQAFEARFPIVF